MVRLRPSPPREESSRKWCRVAECEQHRERGGGGGRIVLTKKMQRISIGATDEAISNRVEVDEVHGLIHAWRQETCTSVLV